MTSGVAISPWPANHAACVHRNRSYRTAAPDSEWLTAAPSGRVFVRTFKYQRRSRRAYSEHGSHLPGGAVWNRLQLSYGSHSNRDLASPAFGSGSFLRGSRAERHSAVQRSPRSHSSASLRSRSAVALSSWARASLRYRIARALLMAFQIPRDLK
jgi:hypothetical protein